MAARHGGSLPPPGRRTAWGHYALGRALLRAGDLEGAAAELERAVRLRPQGLWPNFYQGLCAYRRGRYADAALAYSVCVGAAPESAGCFTTVPWPSPPRIGPTRPCAITTRPCASTPLWRPRP